jgi:hypothetical protein
VTYSSPPPLTSAPQSIIDIIHPRHSLIGQLARQLAAPASGAWTTAATAVIVPFEVWENCTVRKLGWLNGSGTMGGTRCMALYNSALTRLVTTTATAIGTLNLVQWVDTADVNLTANTLYYAAYSASVATANNVFGLSATQVALSSGLLCNIQQQASVDTLPDPLVPATLSAARFIPNMYLSVTSGAA